MSYRLVKGEFHLFYQGERHVGSQPDGDSVWFKPDDPKHLENVGDRSVDFNGGGFTQLRFEAIDALELHYKGAEQSHTEAIAARDFTLKDALGFTTVEYSGEKKLSVKSASPHPRRGYILTKALDPYGRPVSFVFAGNTSRTDGSDPFLTVAWMNNSVNAALAEFGNAYPAFYTGLPLDLRRRVVAISNNASANGDGLWSKDRSTKGAKITGLDSLQATVIWPKLFRRLVSYFQGGNTTLSGFDGWLREDEDRDDALWIVSEGRLENMHDVIEVIGERVKMKYRPDDVIIVPR